MKLRTLLFALLLPLLAACDASTDAVPVAAAPAPNLSESAWPLPPTRPAASGYAQRHERMPNAAMLEVDPVWQAERRLDAWSGEDAWLQEAHALLVQVLAREPNNHEALLQMSRLSLVQGRAGHFRALDLLNQALRAKPDFGEAYVLRGHILTNLGRDADARAALKTAGDLHNASLWLSMNMATIESNGGWPLAAAERCGWVLEQNPPNTKIAAAALHCRSEGRAAQRDWAGVERDLQAALALRPDDAFALGNYAQFLCARADRCAEAAPLMAKGHQRTDNMLLQFADLGIAYDAWAKLVASEGIDAPAAEAAFVQAQRHSDDLDRVLGELGTRYRNEAIVAALLAKGANIDADNFAGHPALAVAASQGYLEPARVLLANGADPNHLHAHHDGDYDQVSALMEAGRGGYVDVLELLVAAGADERSNPTAAIAVARGGKHAEAVAFLEATFPAAR